MAKIRTKSKAEIEKEKLEEKIETYLDEEFYGEYAPYDKVREMAVYFYELGKKGLK